LTVIAPDWSPSAPLQRLDPSWANAAGVELAVLRLDLLDPLISGNKWFKLKHHLEQAAAQGARGLISLGGAHSNHLHALAAAGQRFGFASVGLLRGAPQDTPTVRDLQAFGMTLHWLDHGAYRARHQVGFWAPWLQRYPGFHAVPEGGGGLPGALGCAALRDMLQRQLSTIGWADSDAWWLAVGSGTTLAGLVLAEAGRRPVYGALAVPERYGIATQVREVLREAGAADQGYRLVPAARGGFARSDDELLAFMQQCEAETAMPLEPVYTAKALLALREAVQGGYVARGSRLVFVHTGGLQGRRAALRSCRLNQDGYTQA